MQKEQREYRENRLNDLQAELDNAHGAYADMLAALVVTCKSRRIMLLENDIAGVMEAVADALGDETERAVTELNEYGHEVGYIPEKYKQMITAAHDEIVDALRIKPIDWSGALKNAFTPRMLTNPETRAAKGEIL